MRGIGPIEKVSTVGREIRLLVRGIGPRGSKYIGREIRLLGRGIGPIEEVST